MQRDFCSILRPCLCEVWAIGLSDSDRGRWTDFYLSWWYANPITMSQKTRNRCCYVFLLAFGAFYLYLKSSQPPVTAGINADELVTCKTAAISHHLGVAMTAKESRFASACADAFGQDAFR
jgi:hypothetical protein